MKKQMVTRNYNLTDGVLKQKADEFVALLDRDEADFAGRGYDAVAKTAFTTAIENLNSISSDEIFEAEKMMQTANKDAARRVLEKAMRTVFNMAGNKFGVQSAQYRAFGLADISKQPDAELARTYKILATTASDTKDALATEGLTGAFIDEIASKGLDFDNAIDAMAKGISDRDIATESRVEGLNALYALLIKYAGIGQDIFYEENEAKYNDYVIYDTPSGLPEENVPPVDPV